MIRPVAIRSLIRHDTELAARQPDQDLVAVEAPMRLQVEQRGDAGQGPRLRRESLGILMRTPGHDDELAAGALLAEGIIADAAAIRSIDVVEDEVTVVVTEAADLSAAAGRGSASTSACGLCGRLEVLRIDESLAGGGALAAVDAALVAGLPDRLRQAQPAFGETGGLHAAGIFTNDGTLVVAREDVGRHNAVDKVNGWLLREGRLPASDLILVVSGRVAYEIVQKAARAGIPIVVAVGAPTDLAVDGARAAGITLAGFVRGQRFNVYTWPERIAR